MALREAVARRMSEAAALWEAEKHRKLEAVVLGEAEQHRKLEVSLREAEQHRNLEVVALREAEQHRNLGVSLREAEQHHNLEAVASDNLEAERHREGEPGQHRDSSALHGFGSTADPDKRHWVQPAFHTRCKHRSYCRSCCNHTWDTAQRPPGACPQ